MDLFEIAAEKNLEKSAPLAERMKPQKIESFFGQKHILGENKILRRLIKADKLGSIILYGPPGVGKTSLARVIAKTTTSDFRTVNAVTSGVKELREVIKIAKDNLGLYFKKTILFIDEIHRFNKAQQDAILPFVEDGSITLIGATTENPYYEVNNALISRSSVFRLEKLVKDEIEQIVKNALSDKENGFGNFDIKVESEALEFLSEIVDGDARKALNAIEIAVLSSDFSDGSVISKEIIEDCIQEKSFHYDKSGDSHYDITSAFIKSIRGSDPDASLHYLSKMIMGGEDIKFIARRLIILASEDIGNADPSALTLAVSGANAIEKIGMPESRIILSQIVTYLASAPKSNSSYIAINNALLDVKTLDCGNIPFYLKDATSLKMTKKNESIDGLTYKYPHSYPNNYVKQDYLPKKIRNHKYYIPSENGYEKKINERMNKLNNIFKKTE
ncbi:replication-associated recombination protein A [Helicovermis profundi]|uniref:Replication-associated recombination protein A n=1 Tax=Helicovermis profundi TaxID=3065157 RepID=A0AAU9E3A0_9FIRM|nr:replication-associated recombination protein A [Clostridia bacterium S502]